VRHHRHEAIQAIKKLEHVSEDDKRHGEKEVQKLTDEITSLIDDLMTAKEAEIMEV
jgi:ribosome recycling factor